MPYLSVSQAKFNKMEKELRAGIIALEQENERLKSLLSEDLVAENAKLKLKIWEMECAIPKIKADAIRSISKDDVLFNVLQAIDVHVNHRLNQYADQVEQGK